MNTSVACQGDQLPLLKKFCPQVRPVFVEMAQARPNLKFAGSARRSYQQTPTAPVWSTAMPGWKWSYPRIVLPNRCGTCGGLTSDGVDQVVPPVVDRLTRTSAK